MSSRTTLMDELSIASRTEETNLEIGTLALTLAALAEPERGREPYQRHLRKLTDDVAAYVIGHSDPIPLQLRHEALVQVIHKYYGYVGTEDCLNNIEAANLMHVIDRRNGVPMAIGILYLHAAAYMGWDAAGIDFPGRFLIRLDGNKGGLIFDGFEGGRSLSAADLRKMLKSMVEPDAELNPLHYRKVGTLTILLKLQDSIKTNHLSAQRRKAALKVLETMVALDPKNGDLWREVGILHTRLNQVPAAIAALEECLRHEISEETIYQATVLLQELRGRLH